MARSGWSAGVNKTALFTLKPTLVKSHQMKGTGNENFIATKVGARNGDLVAFKRVAWREVCELAPLLAEVNDVAQYEHPCMLVEVLDSEVLAAVLDVSYTRWPLWFVKLPDSLWPHAQELAMRFPSAVNKESDNLLHKHTYYCSLVVPNNGCTACAGDILDRGVGYVFFSGFVEASITRACELGGINVLLSAGPSVVLASYALNEDEVLGLQGAGGSAGPNWRPYRIYEEEDIAAVAWRGAGGDNFVLGTLPAGQYSCGVIAFGHRQSNGAWWWTK